jgi:hypothetical protein
MDTTDTTPPERAIKARDGHERVQPPLDEWLRLIELSSLTEWSISGALGEQLGITQAAASMALGKLRKGRTRSLRQDFYEAALELLQADLAPLDAEVQALVKVCLAYPYQAAAHDDLEWTRSAMDEHRRALKLLADVERDHAQRVKRYGGVVHEQRAELAVLASD